MASKRLRKGETKRCAHCEEFKPLAEFPPNRATADGLAAYCRPCKREVGRRGAEEKPKAPTRDNLPVPPPPRRNQRGPASTITDDLIEELCSVLRRGHTRRAACRKCGVSEDTFAVWMKRGSEKAELRAADLYRAVIEAEGEGEFALLELVRASAEFDSQQAKWILERRYSQGEETWVRKEHIDLSTGPEMPEVSVVRELILAKLKGLSGSAAPSQPPADASGGRQGNGDAGSGSTAELPVAPPVEGDT